MLVSETTAVESKKGAFLTRIPSVIARDLKLKTGYKLYWSNLGNAVLITFRTEEKPPL